jgi:putative ABC transport system permease protein
VLAIIGLVIFIGIIAGSYPAFYISKLPVISIFRDARTSLGKSGWMRKILVTVQFTLSISLIIATLTVLSQLNFMRNKELGFTKKNMLAITLPPGDSTQFAPLQALKAELRNIAPVHLVARSANIPGDEIGRFVVNVRTSSGNQDKPISTMFTDAEFLTMSKMNLVEGRLFTEADAAKPFGYCLVNEAMVKQMGWTDALSEKLTIPGDDQNPAQEIQVIGVIRDFHFASLHHPIEPLVIGQQNPRGVGGNLMVELQDGNPSEALTQIEAGWKKVFPNKEFNYKFLEDTFRKMYETEEKVFSVFIYFAMLAIVLCCLGLYGLSAFTTEQRTKEIGIRKVMGASVNNILVLLNKDFMKLVIASIILATPLAWYAVRQWLDNFAYRTDINPMYFFVASLFAVLITLITVSLHAMNTALRDPIKALRYE